ncbi:MAG: HDOD domain-containing protein [Oscillospiraceae bacterium]|nr:HDOD domain-containing protein [Oscillospiraceae bacterium]
MNVYMTRQPIFDQNGSVYAYEIPYRGSGEDSVSADDIPNPFLGLDIQKLSGSAKALVNFSEELLLYGAPKRISPEILAVGVSESVFAAEGVADEIRELKKRGYMIVLDGFVYSNSETDLFDLADLVKIDIKAPQKMLEETSSACRSANKPMFAENVETQYDAEYAKKLGCAYMRGYYFARPPIASGGGVQPLPVNLMKVMQLMAQPEPEIGDIVDVMSRDTAMCQKILRLINSVYFGMSNKVSSINQAILILGLDYLREWVYLMGMQKITQNDNMEVMKLALLLAKFCRGLSELIPDAADKGESFYLMGLLSMIVFSSERALAQALDEFPLANDIKKGLLRRGGIYSDVFEMALAYIDGNWEEFDDVAAKYNIGSDGICELFAQCAQEVEKLNLVE